MRKDIQRIRDIYTNGMRVRLVYMDDEKAPPIGCEGIVQCVDDMGSVVVIWENGSRLNVVLDKDKIEIIS